MTLEQVEKIRDNSDGYQAAKRFAKNGKINSPWVDHFEEMGRKTAVRRIAKYLPMDVQKAAAIADSYDTGRHSELQDGDIVITTPTEEDDTPQQGQIESKSQLDQFADEGADQEETAEEVQEEPAEKKPSLADAAYIAGMEAFDKGLTKEPPAKYNSECKTAFSDGYKAAEKEFFEQQEAS